LNIQVTQTNKNNDKTIDGKKPRFQSRRT